MDSDTENVVPPRRRDSVDDQISDLVRIADLAMPRLAERTGRRDYRRGQRAADHPRGHSAAREGNSVRAIAIPTTTSPDQDARGRQSLAARGYRATQAEYLRFRTVVDLSQCRPVVTQCPKRMPAFLYRCPRYRLSRSGIYRRRNIRR
jgi:hypothetical protein